MTAWRRAVEARLGERQDLGCHRLWQEFWSGLPEDEVLGALELIEAESEISAGLFRPTDRLHDLFQAPVTKNPFRWMQFQTRSSDGLLEVSYQLSKRLRRRGAVDLWGGKVYTVDEFVQAWCAPFAVVE
jgi:hypothetical protein